jgi:hypothetical protein
MLARYQQIHLLLASSRIGNNKKACCSRTGKYEPQTVLMLFHESQD